MNNMTYKPVIVSLEVLKSCSPLLPRKMTEFEIFGVESFMNNVLGTDYYGDFNVFTDYERLYITGPVTDCSLPDLPEEYNGWIIVHLYMCGEDSLVALVGPPDELDSLGNAVLVKLN